MDVAADGRFLINTDLDSAAAPITQLQNRQSGLPARERAMKITPVGVIFDAGSSRRRSAATATCD